MLINLQLSDVVSVEILKWSKKNNLEFTMDLEVYQVLERHDEIDSFCNFLHTEQYPSSSLRTMPKYIFKFIGDDQIIEIGYLGHGHIRWLRKGNDIDYKLTRPRLLINWLIAIGLSDPDTWGRIANEKAKEQKLSEEENLIKLLPSKLKDSNVVIKKRYLELELFPDYKELLREFDDEEEMLKQFFRMFLSKRENISWKVDSNLQSLLLKILFCSDVEKINSLITIDLLDSEKEGIAKYLTSTEFQSKRKEDLSAIKKNGKNIIMSFLQRQGIGPKIRAFRKKVMI